MIPQPIVDAMRAGHYMALPDRSGFFVVLDVEGPGIVCPAHARDGVTMFAVVRQCPPRYRTSYTCLRCWSPAELDAVA